MVYISIVVGIVSVKLISKAKDLLMLFDNQSNSELFINTFRA